MQIQQIVAVCAAAALGCSASAQPEPQVTAAGALRAKGLDGTDYGLVYHLERMQVPVMGGGAALVGAAVLEVPGAVPFLEWRMVRSGEAYPCPSFHELPGCTGAAALSDLTLGFACAGADGHAYLPDVLAVPTQFSFQSVRMVTFDGTSFVVTCTDGAGTAPRALLLGDAGVSRSIASRLVLQAAD